MIKMHAVYRTALFRPFIGGRVPEYSSHKNVRSTQGKDNLKGQMNQNFDILSLAILKQPNVRRIHY